MSGPLVQILDGNTFVVSDDRGDIEASLTDPTGLFSFDTRFLSKWVLTIDGQRLNPLSMDDLNYFESRFFLVPGTGTVYVDSKLSVIRQRAVGNGFHEELTILNHEDQPVDGFGLELCHVERGLDRARAQRRRRVALLGEPARHDAGLRLDRGDVALLPEAGDQLGGRNRSAGWYGTGAGDPDGDRTVHGSFRTRFQRALQAETPFRSRGSRRASSTSPAARHHSKISNVEALFGVMSMKTSA